MKIFLHCSADDKPSNTPRGPQASCIWSRDVPTNVQPWKTRARIKLCLAYPLHAQALPVLLQDGLHDQPVHPLQQEDGCQLLPGETQFKRILFGRIQPSYISSLINIVWAKGVFKYYVSILRGAGLAKMLTMLKRDGMGELESRADMQKLSSCPAVQLSSCLAV